MPRNPTLLLIAILSLLACSSPPQKEDREKDLHFGITLDIEQPENGKAILSFEISPENGYYFVSPHSEGKHQRLLFSLENTNQLFLEGELIEDPPTEEDYDEFTEKRGNFVREKTSYRQVIYMSSTADFEVSGLIWLGLLPDFQPYEIGFILSNKAGQLAVEKIEITPSEAPTFKDNKRLDVI